MKLTSLAASAALILSACLSSAQMLVVNRPLPVANLNNAAGSNRSNVSWAYSYGNDGMEGDLFTLPTLGAGQSWKITGITTWLVVGSSSNNQATDLTPGAEFSNVQLYLGDPHADMSVVDSGNFVADSATDDTHGTFTDNSDISITKTHYQNGESYQGYSGSYVSMYQLDFNNLNIAAGSGQSFGLGVIGSSLTVNGGQFAWFNHYSNAALGGSPTVGGVDNLIEEYDFTGHYLDEYDSTGNGWDKSSDMNILVYAQVVPEPSEFGFLAIAGLGMLTSLRRKIKKA